MASLAHSDSSIQDVFPSWVLRAMELVVLTSFLVIIEPAPTDVVFLGLAGGLFLTGRLVLPSTFHPVAWGGLFVFLIGDLVSVTAVRFNMGRALFSWAVSTYMIVLMVLFAALVSRGGVRCTERILRALKIAGVICAVFGVVALSGFLPIGKYLYRDDSALRIRSTFKDPNVMGPFLVPAFLITLDYLRQRKDLLINFASLFCVGIILLLCFSRAAWLNLALALAIYCGLHLHLAGNLARGLSLACVGFVFLGIVVGAILFLGDSLGFGDYLLSRLRLQGYDGERIRHYRLALNLCADYPLGIGPMQTVHMIGKQVHSLYLGVATESGIPAALGLFVLILASLYRSAILALTARAHRPLFILILACVAGQLLNSLFVNSMHWRHMFLVLALPWTTPHIVGRDSPTGPHETQSPDQSTFDWDKHTAWLNRNRTVPEWN